MIWFFLIVTIGIISWMGRRIPLSAGRKWLAIGARLCVVAVLCTALFGVSRRSVSTVPRRVIYLVDDSASLDPAQREWIAARLAWMESLRPSTVERALIVFGGEAAVAAPVGRASLGDAAAIRRLLDQTRIPRDQTNLEAALFLTLPLALPAERSSLVLFSDGQETAGHATALLPALRQLGVRVFAEAPPTGEQVASRWDRLVVPPTVRLGAPVPVQLVVEHGTSRAVEANVTISLQGVTIAQQRVLMRPGSQVLTLSVPAIARGTMALDVQLAVSGEGPAETRRAYTEVEGPPSVLFVTDQVTTPPALAVALKRRKIDVTAVRPADLPTDASRLLDYDAVLLFNVAKSSLPADRVEALRTYIEDTGGGLLMVGLGGNLAAELEYASGLDPLLPLQFEPKGLHEAKRRVCMMMLIDRSNSMSGAPLAATKRAAVALVSHLNPDDLIGVLAFDAKPYVVAEVQSAAQARAGLVEKLVTLHSTGGTDIYPALVAAGDRLNLTSASLKHIMLLTDGQTSVDQNAYDALLKSFVVHGISISTIGVGATNVDYMQWLARVTGGTFYQLRRLDELPQLIVDDAQQALGRLPFAEGLFRVFTSPTTEWFPDHPRWPPLRGYVTATARPGARVDLLVDTGTKPSPQATVPLDPTTPMADAAERPEPEPSGEPLLARWARGRGRVAAFTSDADTRWSPEWIRWEGFENVWAQIVRWTMRPRLTEELFVWIDETRSVPEMMIEGKLRDPHATMIAAAEGIARPVSLVQDGPWRWRASLEQVPDGWHRVMIESSQSDAVQAAPTSPPSSSTTATPEGRQSVAARWIRVGRPPAFREQTGQPSNEALLRQLTVATSAAYAMPDQAFLPPTVRVPVMVPLLGWYLPLVIMLLLIDVWLRGSSML